MNPNPMHAITLYQPWATLLILGVKRFETRCWTTKIRGEIAIHAAQNQKHLNKLLDEFRSSNQIATLHPWARNIAEVLMENKHLISGADLKSFFPTGCVLGTAEIAHIYAEQPPALSERERLLGEYGVGRFAWEMTNIVRLPTPIAATGRQRLWRWYP